ncbi:hypothetical protein ACWDTI_09825 [Gordonia sp. NPDC003424]
MSTDTIHVRVGDRTDVPAQLAAQRLEVSGLCLPSESALIGRAFAELALPPVPAATRTTVHWTATHPVRLLDSVRVESVITRIADGAVSRSVRLLDETDTVREDGTETWHLDVSRDTEAALDFCTPAWGELLRTSLEGDPAFGSSLSTWDGTIGLRCGDREVHLRIYRGRIIDVTRRVPHGATFTFVAPENLWIELVFSDHDEFMRRAIGGEFSSTGDGYEYVRLTKPLNIIIGHARRIAREARA